MRFKEPRIHLRSKLNEKMSLCLANLLEYKLTDDPEKVTCNTCLNVMEATKQREESNGKEM